MYNGVCKECGYNKQGTLDYFKRTNAQKCTHCNKLTQEQKDAWYEKNKKQCLYCGEFIPIGNKMFSEYNAMKFCNHSCSASYNNKGVRRNYKEEIDYESKNYCLNCNNEIPLVNKYCSHECQHEYQQKQWEEKWFAGEINGNRGLEWIDISKRVRKYLFKKYDNKCARCGWGETNQYTGKIPLEVEHIDGNPYNTTPENVTLLCPNCHSLTSTYKWANKGNGRAKTWMPKKTSNNVKN